MSEINSEKFKFTENNVCEEVLPNYDRTIKQRVLNERKFKIGIILLILIIGLIMICPIFSKWTIDQVFKGTGKELFPSKEHWFGITQTGNDLFIMMWTAARNTVRICLKVIFFDISIGFVFGGICSYYGGIVDSIIMRIVEIIMSIHVLVLVVLLYITLGQCEESLVMGLAIYGSCSIITSIRGQLLEVREQEYILAAKSLGASASRVLTRHFFRNIFGTAVVVLTLEIPNTILIESGLSFMGLGVNLTLGNLMAMNRGLAIFYPYTIIIPATLLIIIALSFNLIGDGLRNAFDPTELDFE